MFFFSIEGDVDSKQSGARLAVGRTQLTYFERAMALSDWQRNAKPAPIRLCQGLRLSRRAEDSGP
jgi:hypothetical protein